MKDSHRTISINYRTPLDNISRGLSGCPIVMNPSGSITKYSSSAEYNNRLLRQAEKQIEFYSKDIENIGCPCVRSIKKGEIFSFEMDYISGSNYLDFLGYASPEYIDFFADSIVKYFKEVRKSGSGFYKSDEFRKACLSKLESLSFFSEYREFSKYLAEKIESTDFSQVDKTFCHGDLTLSNILFTTETIFFLDFLDSFVESWLVDLAKLKQDLFYLWSLSRERDNLDLRSAQVSLHIWDILVSEYRDVVNSDEFKIIESINFLRILPYIKSRKDLSILKSIIEKTPLYEEFNNTHGR